MCLSWILYSVFSLSHVVCVTRIYEQNKKVRTARASAMSGHFQPSVCALCMAKGTVELRIDREMMMMKKNNIKNTHNIHTDETKSR